MGQADAISCNLVFCSSGVSAEKIMSRSITVVILSSLFSLYILTFTEIEGIFQPLRSIYMRNVASVQEARDESSKVWGSGPRSFPPEDSGSSEINFPFRHSIVHSYFPNPMEPRMGFSNL